MLGFVGGYDQAEFVSDIKLAHSKGIDGFVSQSWLWLSRAEISGTQL
jgi:hypothetical protein